MEYCSIDNAASHLNELLDEVIDNNKIISITQKDMKSVVIMSKQHYDGLIETIYLLSSPNNRAYLEKSIKQLNRVKLSKA